MGEFTKRNLNEHIREVCDSVSGALGLEYSVVGVENGSVAFFEPVKDVNVLVRHYDKSPYVGVCDSVNVVFGSGGVFEDYAGVVETMGKVEGWRLYGGSGEVGRKLFRENYEKNVSSGDKVEVEIQIDYGLTGVLMYMFSNMRNCEKLKIISLGAETMIETVGRIAREGMAGSCSR